MSYIYLKEVWSPLKMFGIRLFRDPSTRKWYAKRNNRRLRRLRFR